MTEPKPNGDRPAGTNIPPAAVAVAKWVAIATACIVGAIALSDAYGQQRTGTVLQWLWSLTGWQPPMPHEVAASIVITLIGAGFLALAILFIRRK